MNDEPLDKLEQQLTSLRMSSAPPALRSAVLVDIHRELRAARWDRRLARAAAVLFVVGVGLNAALALSSKDAAQSRSHQIARQPSQHSFVETAVAVAEATNAETGSQFARHMAVLSGRTLTGDELAAIDAAIEQQSTHTLTNGEG